jgi:hypothetical protein
MPAAIALIPEPALSPSLAPFSFRLCTQLVHEGLWPSGAVVVMTSTTYNAVKHSIT